MVAVLLIGDLKLSVCSVMAIADLGKRLKCKFLSVLMNSLAEKLVQRHMEKKSTKILNIKAVFSTLRLRNTEVSNCSVEKWFQWSDALGKQTGFFPLGFL